MPEILFQGQAGRLEGRYHQSPSPTGPLALLLHPHPLHGGTMHNKVVYAMYNAFAARDFSVMRFNFRGVGKSEGRYDGGQGELDDAATALDWMQASNPNARGIFIAGFSFGSWIGMQLLMRRPEIGTFISIAPPANMMDFSFLAPCPTSGLVVHGDADELVPESSVSKLVQKLSFQRGITIDYRVVPFANHFFNHHLDVLKDHIESYIDSTIHRVPLALAG